MNDSEKCVLQSDCFTDARQSFRASHKGRASKGTGLDQKKKKKNLGTRDAQITSPNTGTRLLCTEVCCTAAILAFTGSIN